MKQLDQSAAPVGTSLAGLDGGVVECLSIDPFGGDKAFDKLEPSNRTLLVESFCECCVGSIL